MNACLTALDVTPLRQSQTCECTQAQKSAEHTRLDEQLGKTIIARNLQLLKHKVAQTSESLTDEHLRPKQLTRFMAMPDLIRVRVIVMYEQEGDERAMN